MLNPLKLNLIRNKEYDLEEPLVHYNNEESVVGYHSLISFIANNKTHYVGDIHYIPTKKIFMVATLHSNEQWKQKQAIDSYGFFIVKTNGYEYKDLLSCKIERFIKETTCEDFEDDKIYLGNIYLNKKIKENITDVCILYEMTDEFIKGLFFEFQDYRNALYDVNLNLRMTYQYSSTRYGSCSMQNILGSIAKELVKTQTWQPLLFKEFDFVTKEAIPFKFRKELDYSFGKYMNSYNASYHELRDSSSVIRHVNGLGGGFNKEYLLNTVHFYSDVFICLSETTGLVEMKTVYPFETESAARETYDLLIFNPGSYECNSYNPFAESNATEADLDRYYDLVLKLL